MVGGGGAGTGQAVRYLQLQGREAAHYNEALDLVNRAEAEQARGEAGESTPSEGRPGLAAIRTGETVVFDGMEFVGIPPGEFLIHQPACGTTMSSR